MSQHTPPGAFPSLRNSKALVPSRKDDAMVSQRGGHLKFKAQVAKFKGYFHRRKEVVCLDRKETSSWKQFWKPSSSKTKKDMVMVHQEQTNTVGSLLTMSVPISINNTTHYYGNNSNGSGSSAPIATSIVQQLIVLPPLQVYGFMFIITLLLLVIAFAILQVHRSLSIVQLAVDGLQYVLVGFTSGSLSAFSFLKSWF